MGKVNAGHCSISVDGTPELQALLRNLFRDDYSRITMDMSWGDIPEGADAIQLMIRLRRETVAYKPVVSNAPSESDAFDGKAAAWNEYFSREEDAGEPVDDLVLSVMPESMVELAEDDDEDDDDFLSEGESV